MKIKGMGGYWLLDTRIPGPITVVGNLLFVAHNAIYEVVTSVDLRETRSTGCGGWAEGLPRFRRLEHAKFSVAEDEVLYPQALGFTEGKEVSFYMKRGELLQFDYVYRAIVKSVQVVNEQTKARTVEIVCKYGRYIRGVPSPTTGTPPFDQTVRSVTPPPFIPQLPARDANGEVIPQSPAIDTTGTGPQYQQQQMIEQGEGE